MASIDNLLKQARALAGATSDDGLDEQWDAMCVGARDRLLAKLAQLGPASPREHITEEDEEGEEEKRVMMAGLKAILAEHSEEAREMWKAQRRRML